MPIQLTGLGGFDSGNVISQLVKIAQKPLEDIDKKKAQIDSASLTLNGFSARLNALKNVANTLSTSTGFTSMAATSTDTSITATVTGLTNLSTFSVDVTSVARAQKTRSDSQTSSTTALGQTGELSIQIGTGTPKTVQVDANDTLTSIATKINQLGIRMSASIVNAGGSYRLMLQGVDTGAANAITLQENNGLALGLSTPANTYESAQDAVVTVDGLTVTRPTNAIADAIPGVTLTVTKPTTATSTVRIAADPASLKGKIQAFVNAYNDVVSAGQSAAGYGSIKASNPELAADPSIRRSLDRISSLSVGVVTGASAEYQSLASVGITRSRDGVLSFDSSKFEAALTRDPEAVRKLFVTDVNIGATGVMKKMVDGITDLTTGTAGAVKNRLDGLASKSRTLVASRDKKAARVDEYEQQLRRQFSKLDQAMNKYNTMSNAISGINKNSSSG